MKPVNEETDYCLLDSVGEATRQQFPQSVLMQVAGRCGVLRVL
jgi:hypothetical protein